MNQESDWDDYYCDNDIILYYDKESNCMVDGDGFEVENLYSVITPNQYFLFRFKKEDMMFYSKEGYPVMLIYSCTEDDFVYG